MGNIDDALGLWWNRYGDELITTLRDVYGEKTDALVERVCGIVAKTLEKRPASLRRLDEARLLCPDQLRQPGTTGYVCYTDRFVGTLNGILGHLGYLHDLGVTYLHLMSLLQSREGANNGGYAMADCRFIRSNLGAMDDPAEVAKGLQERNISLVVDLVLNHVAKEYERARRAQAGKQRYRDCFMIYPDRTVPDQYEQILPEVFPSFVPRNFIWDEEFAEWVRTTFNDYQRDVNWANPDVFYEYLEIIYNPANRDVEVLRLDVIVFIWKQMDTDRQSEPPAHKLVEALRAAVRIAASTAVFKAETIIGPRNLIAYFGRGRHYGELSDLAYHNSLTARLWPALISRDATLLRYTLEQSLAKPPTAIWGVYVHCHDNIGWAASNRDAVAVGINGTEHRRLLPGFYSGEFPKPFAHGPVFQASPITGDRRVSGTLASLAGLELAPESKGQEATDLTVGRINMLYAVIYGFGEVPLICMGDELVILDDCHCSDDSAHAEGSRWVHHPVMDWDAVAALTENPDSAQTRVNAWLWHALDIRRATPQLHTGYELHILGIGGRRVLVVRRDHPIGPMYQLYNLPEHGVSILIGLLCTPYGSRAKELLGDVTWNLDPTTLSLEPHQAYWLVVADGLEE